MGVYKLKHIIKMKKIYFIIVFSVILIFEIYLRIYWGFCDTVLIRKDSDYEYIAIPSQKHFRFRNNIYYNSFSMRSPEVDTSALIFLGLGDSVLNGGVLTEQDSLATSIVSATLTNEFGKRVQFLNISAGSWGPDNCYAYIKKNGLFNAAKVYLIVSSHDAYDNMDFQNIVGVDVNFPQKQYSFALFELFERYLLPRIKSVFGIQEPKENLGINKRVLNSHFNTGFFNLANLCKSKNIELIVYLHAEQDEIKRGEYNNQGKTILEFCESNNLKVLKDLNLLSLQTDYRDNIHINNSGQKKLADLLLTSMKEK